jgi:hypothetical protein
MQELVKPITYPTGSGWEILSDKDIDELFNTFCEKGMLDKFHLMMNKNRDELKLYWMEQERETQRLKHEANKLYFVNFLYTMANTYPQYFFDEHSMVDYENALQEINGIWYISTDYFDFSSNEIALKAYNIEKPLNGLFKFDERKEGFLNYQQFFNIIKYIGNPPIKQPKKVVYTYLMTDASGYVKIGKAHDVYNRFLTLRTGNPTLKIVAHLDENIESKLHQLFNPYRIIGEWFELSKDIINDLIEKYEFKLHSKQELLRKD